MLVVKYQRRILNLVRRIVDDREQAMDVCQETFIRAYQGLEKFRGDSAFYTWLYRIALNTARNHVAGLLRWPATVPLDEHREPIESAWPLTNIGDKPEQELHRQRLRKVVHSAVDTLPKDLKTAITLREIDGFSYEEIARAMSCPIGTVRSRIFRAREAIEKCLKPIIKETDVLL